MANNTVAMELEEARDLRGRLSGLGRQDREEIAFDVLRPGTFIVTLYSMETGEMIKLPDYMAGAALNKRSTKSKTGWMFTSHADNAPAVVHGTVRCFLHPDAPEADVIRELGMVSDCTMATLANNYAKTTHAQHRHAQRWAMFQEHVRTVEAEAYRDEQRQLTAAMVKVAEGTAKGKSA